MLSKSPSYLPTPPNFPVLGYFLPLLCGISYCNVLCGVFFPLFFFFPGLFYPVTKPAYGLLLRSAV